MREEKASEGRKEEIQKRIDESKKIVRQALEKFKPSEAAITWTGGKDSTTNLWNLKKMEHRSYVAL